MKIEFGVQEYFNELKLMDAQYGQEEELYSWIYMLLKMAECRKKEILKEWYQEVSIRDVHKGVKKKDNDLIKLLRQKKGFPDHVILERKYEEYRILGCSEIKKNEEKLELKEGTYEVTEDTFMIPQKYDIEFYFNTDNIRELENINEADKKKIEENCDYVEAVDNFIENIIVNIVSNKENNYMIQNLEFTKHQKKTRSYKGLIQNAENKNDLDNFLNGIQNYDDIKKLGYLRTETTESDWKFNTNLEFENSKQILSHLEKFKKVLYTNGLEFYYLVLNEKKIDVKKIADLQPMYAEYKENTTPSPQLLLEASAEWDRLIAGLTSIDWHKDPVAKIPRTQPDTQE
mgnify:CR=1 FL=1